MNKVRVGLLVCLIMVFTLLSSTMALAATGTTCPLNNVNGQQVSANQLLNLVKSNSCSGITNCIQASCPDTNSCVTNGSCQNLWTSLFQTTATKAASNTGTCSKGTCSNGTCTTTGCNNTAAKAASGTCPQISQLLGIK